ncbi:MAG TPA: molybdenum cofactor guanylyltransferase [Terriglobales bacterium]|jgi:molybdopterin-guanine dinucleotide biosynthesis protein A
MSSSISVCAFVLAGGKSSRMGTDKALLRLDGQALIVHALALATSVTNDVKIVGDPEKFASFGEVVPDIYAERGPLGGIHAALLNSATECNLILGVDLPFVQPRFLSFLVSEAQTSGAIVTLPSTSGYLQTLCAVYRKEFLGLAESALGVGRNRIDALFPAISVRVINEQEVTTSGFDRSMFRNLNTPEEWEFARKEFESRRLDL